MDTKDIQHSPWWRFEAYEIIGGTHITPKHGSTIHYYSPMDPTVRSLQPCLSLYHVDLEDEQAILNWCNQYGLLGILHYRTISAFLAPRWQTSLLHPAYLTPNQQSYTNYRSPRSYSNQQNQWKSLPLKTKKEGSLVTQRDILRDFNPTGGLITHCTGETQKTVAMHEAFGRFFPMYPEAMALEKAQRAMGFAQDTLSLHNSTQKLQKLQKLLNQADYPLPHTEEFNLSYSEPLQLFRLYAYQIQQSLELLKQIKQYKHYQDFENLISDHGFKTHHTRTLEHFQHALSGISPQPTYTTQSPMTWSWMWKANSLFEQLNWMILTDLTSKTTHLKHCAKTNCNRLFIALDNRTRYHSKQCKRAAQTANLRHRKKLKQAQITTIN